MTDAGPAYVTDVAGDETTVSAESCVKLVAEVRDRFSAPVGGATVTATVVDSQDPGGSLSSTCGGDADQTETVRTTADGRVAFVYEAGSGTGTVQVNVSVAGPSPSTDVIYGVRVESAGGNQSGGNQGGGNQSGDNQSRGAARLVPPAPTPRLRARCRPHPGRRRGSVSWPGPRTGAASGYRLVLVRRGPSRQ